MHPVLALIHTGLAFPPVVVGLAIFLLLSRSGPLAVLDLLYSPTAIEFGIMIGSFSLFFLLYLLFVKHLPSVSMTEIKETVGKGDDYAR